MEFTCAHCGKLINCSTKIVDGNFLHTTCEVAFNEAKIEAKLNPEEAERIEKLFGCCKSTTLDEE